jgi:DNA-binding SARP family transcriptional activator
MIELRTLGGLEVEVTPRPGPAILQPKRLALLAYLAVARPSGFLRRDVLLALFWPELPPTRARLALRQALHHLRGLADAASPIQGRGANEVAACGERVSCDACIFELDCLTGRASEALALYRGDFLEGVHVAGASPEFEDWVTARRRHLRGLAARAAWSVAETAGRLGDVERVLAAAQRAVELAPDDEPGLRRFMLLLDAAGNRATALRHYELFARRLTHELGAAPSPATIALAVQLRDEGRTAGAC